MLHRVLPWLFACALVAVIALRVQAQTIPSAPPMPPGLVLVARVVGDVTMTHNGDVTALRVDDRIPQAAQVNTGPASSVVLAFSNGATTQLGEDTELILEEFLQDPFGATLELATLTEEPTASRTKLALNRGELVGHVKRLKHDRGSSFIVQTPVGAAGIRGTTFRIVFRPTGTGLAFFQLSTVEGNVVFQPPGTPAPTPGGTATPGAPGQPGQPDPTTGVATPDPGAGGAGAGVPGAISGISVTGGQEVVVNVAVNVNPTTGQIVIAAPPTIVSAVPINPQTQAAIIQQAQTIAVAVATTTFTAPPPATPAPGSAPGAPAAAPSSTEGVTDPGTTGTTGSTGTTGTTGTTGSTPNGTGTAASTASTSSPGTSGTPANPGSAGSPAPPSTPPALNTTPTPPVQQAPRLTAADGRPGG